MTVATRLFGGYDRYYGNLYADQYARLPSTLRRHLVAPVLKRLPRAGWYKSKVHQLRWLHELSFLAGGERYAFSLAYFHFALLQRRRLFTPEALVALGAADAEAAIRTPYERAGGAPLDRMLYADSKVRIAGPPRDDHRPDVDGAWARDAQSIHGPPARRICRKVAGAHEGSWP